MFLYIEIKDKEEKENGKKDNNGSVNPIQFGKKLFKISVFLYSGHCWPLIHIQSRGRLDIYISFIGY